MIVEFIKVFKEEDLKDGYGAEYVDNLFTATLKSAFSSKPIYHCTLIGRKEILKKFRLMRPFGMIVIKNENIKDSTIKKELDTKGITPYCNGVSLKIKEKYSTKREVKIELVKIEL